MAKSSKISGTLRKADDPEQSRAFIEKAREIEADEKAFGCGKLMERLEDEAANKRKVR